MTDDEKLARIESLEHGFWVSLDGALDSEWLHKNLASIERCQRIRANLQANQDVELPTINISDNVGRTYDEIQANP